MDSRLVPERPRDRVVGKLLVAIGLAILLAVVTPAIIEWYHGMSDIRPEYQDLSPSEWAYETKGLSTFIVLYLLPVLGLNFGAGSGREGLASVAVFALAWLGTATVLGLPPAAMAALFWTIPYVLAIEFTLWIYQTAYETAGVETGTTKDFWDE